jgi:putative sigma-54 modulation protein
MEIEVRLLETDPGDAIKSYAVRRIRFALGRFSSRVGRVVIRLSDINGDRGGVDQCCHIAADLVPAGKVVIEQTDADLFTAVDRACDRLAQAFRRELERTREKRTTHNSVRHMIQ